MEENKEWKRTTTVEDPEQSLKTLVSRRVITVIWFLSQDVGLVIFFMCMILYVYIVFFCFVKGAI